MNMGIINFGGSENSGEHRKFSQSECIDAKIVSVGKNGELIYADHNGRGSKLIDFSYAGYKKGNEPIPDVKVVKTVETGNLDDHTALIQGAIDEVAALPLEERGAILLRAGKYTVTGTLKINASGIVLCGEGQGENGTVIYDARQELSSFTLSISGTGCFEPICETAQELANDYIASGATELPLADVSAYKVGDDILVICTPNDLWVQTLGMDVIPGVYSRQWEAHTYVMRYERWITDIDEANKTITLNTGIPITLDRKYYSSLVYKAMESEGRISECGVEKLRFVTHFDKNILDDKGNFADENHTWSALSLSYCRDSWVREVSAKHYAGSAVWVGDRSKNVTVEGCSYLEPVSLIRGGRRYSFNMGQCQDVLVKNCYSYDSRHDYALGSRVSGPNVYLDSVAENSNNGSEPHHRWATGILWDNVRQIGANRLGYFIAINSGWNGTGHGWMGANTVFWNCLSPATVVGKPQTEENFAVGAYGIYDISHGEKHLFIDRRYPKFTVPTIETPNYPETVDYENSPMYGNGYIEAPYNPVNPSSLYKAQLSYRLYGDARKNVKPSAPILQIPMPDARSEKSSISFGGVCDVSAEKVFVWVDGEKHEALVTKGASNAFGLTLDLADGYYDICVSQVIDGVESDRCAVRTILVDTVGK